MTNTTTAAANAVQADGIPMIRVACITLDGSTLIVPSAELQRHIEGFDTSKGDVEGDESEDFTLTFKTMLLRDYEALGEFDGF